MADGQNPNTNTEEKETKQQIEQYTVLGRTIANISRHLLDERIRENPTVTNAIVTAKIAVSRNAAVDLSFIEARNITPKGCCIAPLSIEAGSFDEAKLEENWASFKAAALSAGIKPKGWPHCDDC